MSMTDPIADMLTRLRNANLAAHDSVEIPASRLKVALTKILREEGFIKHYKIVKSAPGAKKEAAGDKGKKASTPINAPAVTTESRQGIIRIYLKYGPNQERVINGLNRVSKPGRRRYVGCEEIPDVFGGLGVAIVSTPKGVMTGRQARQQRVGGELLALVW